MLTRKQCEWQDCHLSFWEIEPFAEHLMNGILVSTCLCYKLIVQADHIDRCPKNKFACQWQGCARKDKVQGARFALVTHMRSHTGEKPFQCNQAGQLFRYAAVKAEDLMYNQAYPECDKVFPRADALQKHLKTAHQEKIVSRRTAGSGRKRKAPEGEDAAAKKAKNEDGDEDGEGGDETLPADVDPALLEDKEKADEDSSDVARLLAENPGQSPEFLRFVAQLAKHTYSTQEGGALNMAYEATKREEDALRAEKDHLLNVLLQRELG